ncbi:hypothetical protein Pelo_17113 [Pelomyxa schiedti]|nr:hypothetical protein Pelo_17113 [Pelomyxa schiedti]
MASNMRTCGRCGLFYATEVCPTCFPAAAAASLFGPGGTGSFTSSIEVTDASGKYTGQFQTVRQVPAVIATVPTMTGQTSGQAPGAASVNNTEGACGEGAANVNVGGSGREQEQQDKDRNTGLGVGTETGKNASESEFGKPEEQGGKANLRDEGEREGGAAEW